MKNEQRHGNLGVNRDSLIRNVGYAIALALVAVVAGAAVPYVFQAGAPIRASEINANLQYLDSLIAAQASDQVIRTSAAVSWPNSTTVFTVPADATSPYILRTITTTGGSTDVYLGSTGGSAAFYMRLRGDSSSFGGAEEIVTGLNIPFAPGESITASMATTGNVGVTLVFSK